MPHFYPYYPMPQESDNSTEHRKQVMDNHYHGCYGNSNGYNSLTPYGSFDHSAPHDMGVQIADPYFQYQGTHAAQHSSMYNHNGNYSNVGAPVMAPLPVDQRYYDYGNHSQAVSSKSQPKAEDEKPRGGVSAVLDYDMEDMTKFVTEMSVGMYELFVSNICIADIDLIRSVKAGLPVSAKFTEWAKAVLAATRLPSATILMSLSYFAIRLRGLSAIGTSSTPAPALHQMLTVALVLGSKFLDDNTFQNKSWADVSGIPVKELNAEEREWLECFNHRLHNDPACCDGFDAWLQQWMGYQSRSEASTAPLRLLNTNIRSHRSMNALDSYKYQAGFNNLPVPGHAMASALVGGSCRVQTYSSHDIWYPNRLEESPPTATPSGPNTPEFYGGQPTDLSHFGSLNQPYYGAYPSLASLPTVFHAGYPTPPYSYWNCHGAACQCQGCRSMGHYMSNHFA